MLPPPCFTFKGAGVGGTVPPTRRSHLSSSDLGRESEMVGRINRRRRTRVEPAVGRPDLQMVQRNQIGGQVRGRRRVDGKRIWIERRGRRRCARRRTHRRDLQVEQRLADPGGDLILGGRHPVVAIVLCAPSSGEKWYVATGWIERIPSWTFRCVTATGVVGPTP